MERSKKNIKDYLFYAEVEKGHTIKVLFDVLCEFFTRLEISISQTGIRIARADQKFTSCHNITIERDGCRGYHCKEEVELDISFNLPLLQKLIKNVKKKESLTLYMKDDTELFFDLKASNSSNKINSRSETISIKTQRVVCKSDESKASTPPATCYYDPIVFDSTDFQKIKKLPYGGTIKIQMDKDNYLCISDIDETYSSKLIFGELRDVEDLYERTFEKDTFRKCAKITGLSNHIQFRCPKIHMYPTYPLFIKIKIGTIGTYELFLKDDDQLETEVQKENELLTDY